MAGENVNVSLIQSALGHRDLKTTLGVYARTGRDAEMRGRQVAQDSMRAAEEISKKRSQ